MKTVRAYDIVFKCVSNNSNIYSCVNMLYEYGNLYDHPAVAQHE